MNVRDLFQLERSLQCNGIVELPAEVEEMTPVGVLQRDLLYGLCTGKDRLNLARDGLKFRDERLPLLNGYLALPGKEESDQVEDGQLGSKGLGRRYTDFRSCVVIHSRVGFPSDTAADSVHQTQN